MDGWEGLLVYHRVFVLCVLVLVYSSLCVSFSPSSCSSASDPIRVFCAALCFLRSLSRCSSCPYYNWVSLDLNIAIYICHTYYYSVVTPRYSSCIDSTYDHGSCTTTSTFSSPVFVFRLCRAPLCLYRVGRACTILTAHPRKLIFRTSTPRAGR